MKRQQLRLIESEFPIEQISVASAAEKSVRQEHLSTLQLWWARRPLGVCRAALFATLCPDPSQIAGSKELRAILDELVPGTHSTRSKLLALTGRLAKWEAVRDDDLMDGARRLLSLRGRRRPLVVDTFAGGGSFPVEALRLGLDAFAGELNPVAVTALRIAIEHLPGSGVEILSAYRDAAQFVAQQLPSAAANLYGRDATDALAYFWCLTFACPSCGIAAPLMRDCWLARGARNTAVRLIPGAQRFTFEVYEPKTARERKAASSGTIRQKAAGCANCRESVSTAWLRERGLAGALGEQLYAKLVRAPGGPRIYGSVTRSDERLASEAALRRVRSRRIRTVPDLPFDPNGVRHLWAMQYGIDSTSALYNRRQGIALLEVAHAIDMATLFLAKSRPESVVQSVRVLLTLTFNRLVMYGTRHAWWQANGEFPANMFGRQAISMVWNYVEIPPQSAGAAGWDSARVWVEKVSKHLARLPHKGLVHLGDAASVPLSTGTVDVVAIDPPYFDSITYAYLADVFYAWMKPLLRDAAAGDFAGTESPKDEEAIVDRKHTLAPSPKTAAHFTQKMREALVSARRILKPDGRLLIMYGHKKVEAWEAILQSLFDAGFVPTASWPLHTERKVKFRHGKVAALSTSCLLVCQPGSLGATKGKPISWDEFACLLSAHLQDLIRRFESNHILGTDLSTSLLAPACALYAQQEVRVEDGTTLTVRGLLARLPHLVHQLERERLTVVDLFQIDVQLRDLARRATVAAARPQVDRMLLEWCRTKSEGPESGQIAHTASRYAMDLLEGRTGRADKLWAALPLSSKQTVQEFFRKLSQVGSEKGATRKLADTALGRISLSSRVAGALLLTVHGGLPNSTSA